MGEPDRDADMNSDDDLQMSQGSKDKASASGNKLNKRQSGGQGGPDNAEKSGAKRGKYSKVQAGKKWCVACTTMHPIEKFPPGSAFCEDDAPAIRNLRNSAAAQGHEDWALKEMKDEVKPRVDNELKVVTARSLAVKLVMGELRFERATTTATEGGNTPQDRPQEEQHCFPHILSMGFLLLVGRLHLEL